MDVNVLSWEKKMAGNFQKYISGQKQNYGFKRQFFQQIQMLLYFPAYEKEDLRDHSCIYK